MATIASTNITGSTGFSAQVGNVVHLIENVVDVATMISADGVTPGSTDTIEMIEVPAGAVVFAAGIEVITAESGNASAQVELGDGVDPNRYVASATVASAGDVATQIQANVPFHYSAADTIDLLGSVAALTNAKLRVWAVMGNVESPLNTADLNTWA
jgi:hypothetical protein